MDRDFCRQQKVPDLGFLSSPSPRAGHRQPKVCWARWWPRLPPDNRCVCPAGQRSLSIPSWLPQREQKSSLKWWKKPKDGARSGGTRCACEIASVTQDRDKIFVISLGNGCCLSCCRGQKKQPEGLALDMVLSVCYLVSI